MQSIKKNEAKMRRVTSLTVTIAAVIALTFGSVTLPVAATTASGTQVIESQEQYFDVNYDNITIWLDGGTSRVLTGQVIYYATSGLCRRRCP